MKQVLTAIALLLCICLAACGNSVPQSLVSTSPTTQATAPTETEPTVTEPTEPTPPEHSELYIPDLSVEDVILYFSEVCLDAEHSSGDGDPSLIQKWETPIVYRVIGDCTEEDIGVLNRFCALLNGMDGFPGIREAEQTAFANTQIHFCSQSELISIMGNHYSNADGAVTYWYHTDSNDIYQSTICIRNDIDQEVRNSVIQEEIYNGLGATQDTSLRNDSLIFSGYSFPQEPTPIDVLILQLLYHPEMKPGMDHDACEAVIRKLYY